MIFKKCYIEVDRLNGLMVEKLNGFIKSVLIKSHDNHLTLFPFNPSAFKPFNSLSALVSFVGKDIALKG